MRGTMAEKQRKKIYLWVFFSFMSFFGALTFCGGLFVVYRYYNTLFSVVPALLALVFLFLCRSTRKSLQREEQDKVKTDKQ